MHNRSYFVLLILLGATIFSMQGCGETTETNPTKMTLKLGGENCEFYLGAVEDALKKVKGVQAVDLQSKKGQVLVTTDGTLKVGQVVGAIDSLSGDGWNCEAEIVK